MSCWAIGIYWNLNIARCFWELLSSMAVRFRFNGRLQCNRTCLRWLLLSYFVIELNGGVDEFPFLGRVDWFMWIHRDSRFCFDAGLFKYYCWDCVKVFCHWINDPAALFLITFVWINIINSYFLRFFTVLLQIIHKFIILCLSKWYVKSQIQRPSKIYVSR